MFLQVSVYAIQREESVLVSAHMNAGKTVIAEYAPLLNVLAENRKPVTQALSRFSSSWKVRNFCLFFCQAGIELSGVQFVRLMTGDGTMNPSAT